MFDGSGDEVDLEKSLAFSSLFNIVVVLICIGFAWFALQSIRFDVFLKDPKHGQAKLLQIILSIVLGYQFGKFIIDYSSWSTGLKHLF